MIIPDHTIKEWAAVSCIPHPRADQINPASLDLRLAGSLRKPHRRWNNPVSRWLAWWRCQVNRDNWDKSDYARFSWTDEITFTYYTLQPGEIVLVRSMEYTALPKDWTAILTLKSSSGRRGLVQGHTGWGDPGFEGTWTFSLYNASPWPIELEAGQRIAQLVFFEMHDRPERDYSITGHYNGQVTVTLER